MPQFIWIVIAGIAIAAAIYLMIMGSRTGFKASYGKGSIVVNGQVVEESSMTELGRILKNAEKVTPDIHHVYFNEYLKLIKEAGGNPDFLAEYEDAKSTKHLLRYVVSGGNGSRSIQKIVENELISKEWQRMKDDIPRYVKEYVWPIISRSVRDSFNAEYDSEILQKDGTRRQRWVPSTDVVVAFTSDKIGDQVIQKVVPIFLYAKECLKSGCKE